MGTLGNQPARKEFHIDLSRFMEELIDICKKHDVTIEAVIEAKKALELERQNDIAVQDGDYRDEQMGGIGDILGEIARAIEKLER